MKNTNSNDSSNQNNIKLKELESRMDKIDENIKLLTTIFDEIIKQFGKIKKEIKSK